MGPLVGGCRMGRAIAILLMGWMAVVTAEAEPARHVVTVHTTDARGSTVAIRTIIEGAGPPIGMLPSSGRDGAEDFDVVAGQLASAGHTVLRPQPRGILGSTGPMEGVSLHRSGDDVAAVIQQLGGGRAVIVGHAFGHFVARMVATDHPALVRGVVLAAAAAAHYAPDIAATPYRAGNLALPDAEGLAALRLGFFAPGHDPAVWLHGWWPTAQTMEANSRERAGVQQAEWWAAGQAPLLELIPASDPFKPRDKWGELGTAYGARVTTVVIPDASHALFPEQHGKVADAILGWVATLPP